MQASRHVVERQRVTDPATTALTVLICTRDRPSSLLRTLEALEAQSDQDFAVVVVDDSQPPDPGALARRGDRFGVVPGGLVGLSRARNLAWQSATTRWVAYLDDDVVPRPDWVAKLRIAMTAHPEATFVSGPVVARPAEGAEEIAVTVHPVTSERVLQGRWTRPWDIGFTLCMAVHRSELEHLGGFDERLGPGVTDFPSAEDMDFNYRFLRNGGVALVTPGPQADHEQWRQVPAIGPHLRGYMAGWSGFSTKHLLTGDPLGGMWLWSLGARDVARMFASAIRRRSRLRLRIAVYKAMGLFAGTSRGITRRW